LFKNLLNAKNLSNTKVLAVSALFAAISIVCGKFLAFNVGDTLRFSFENLPIIIISIFFGPLSGMLCGVVADLLGCLLRGYAINPILTLASAYIGFSVYYNKTCKTWALLLGPFGITASGVIACGRVSILSYCVFTSRNRSFRGNVRHLGIRCGVYCRYDLIKAVNKAFKQDQDPRCY
jgi:ECF transporter S component (folate family)